MKHLTSDTIKHSKTEIIATNVLKVMNNEKILKLLYVDWKQPWGPPPPQSLRPGPAHQQVKTRSGIP